MVTTNTRLALVAIYLATLPMVANAYIDPGNGAYMLQAIFAIVGAGLFYLRHPIRTLKALFERFSGRGKPVEVTVDDELLQRDGSLDGGAKHDLSADEKRS